ncbi:MAG: hypothetical protein KKA81_07770 [Bacteroidetes bacterium]|nr:hypothetical protein [Bacteroidota bacterium]
MTGLVCLRFKGTGPELSMSYGIITKGRGGTLNVDSLPGNGSSFIIHLQLTKNDSI